LLSAGYAFLAAYLKGEESKMVSAEHMDAIFRNSKVQDALVSIKDTDMGGYFEEVSPSALATFDDVDLHLWLYLGKCLDQFKWFSIVPKEVRQVVAAHVVKYDVSNVKVALRGLDTEEKVRMIPVGVIHNAEMLESLSGAETVDDIIQVLVQSNLSPYAAILKESEEALTQSSKQRLAVEAELDKQYYADVLASAKKMKDGKQFLTIQGVVTDYINLQVIFRAVINGIGPEASGYLIAGGSDLSAEIMADLLNTKFGDLLGKLESTRYKEVAEELTVNYDRTHSITVVDEVIEMHKFTYIREMVSTKILSPLLMSWYLVLKELEVRNVRLILKAISDDVPYEKIKDYLVLSS
jgi:V/A-type H+/Na+-transporting ATPase subunit C